MDLNRSGIYQIRNTVNNRIYIGSTQKFKQRKWSHLNTLRRNNHDNPYLQNDYNKCGENAFRFFIIEFCEIEELLQYEQKWLDVLWDGKKRCYNMLPTAGNWRGNKHSEETKKKIGLAKKGKKIHATIQQFIILLTIMVVKKNVRSGN